MSNNFEQHFTVADDGVPSPLNTPDQWIANMAKLWREVQAAKTAADQAALLALWKGCRRATCPGPDYAATRARLVAELEKLES